MSREEVGLDWFIDFNSDLLPFSCGGETHNHVIGVRYELLNEHLLIITLAEGALKQKKRKKNAIFARKTRKKKPTLETVFHQNMADENSGDEIPTHRCHYQLRNLDERPAPREKLR